MTTIDGSSPARARSARRALTGLMFGLATAVLFWGSREYSRAQGSLEGAIDLAASGKLDEAEARARARVEGAPGDNAARILLAQILLRQAEKAANPSDPARVDSARRAIEYLEPVRPDTPAMAATVHLTLGNALDRLSRLDEAETAWLQALSEDPTTPEAGWNLLNLYYLQWREEEARRLALRLFEIEPDGHDRLMLLMELLRHDARPPAPGSIVKLFEPVVQARPDDLRAPMALGLAMTRASRGDEGVAELRRVTRSHPQRVEAWDCLLICLDESGEVGEMADELERLPTSLAESPRLLKHRARIAQGRKWRGAVELYRRARDAEPYNRVIEYRLSRALRHIGQDAEADRIEARLVRRDTAVQELRPLYDRATATDHLRVRDNVPLLQKIAENREFMQFPEEAIAWHRLIIECEPDNPASKSALARLGQRKAPAS